MPLAVVAMISCASLLASLLTFLFEKSWKQSWKFKYSVDNFFLNHLSINCQPDAPYATFLLKKGILFLCIYLASSGLSYNSARICVSSSPGIFHCSARTLSSCVSKLVPEQHIMGSGSPTRVKSLVHNLSKLLPTQGPGNPRRAFSYTTIRNIHHHQQVNFEALLLLQCSSPFEIH